MKDVRTIRKDGVRLGAMSIRRAMELIEEEGSSAGFEFWSNYKGAWLPIAKLVSDLDNPGRDRVAEMKRVGIKYVLIIDSGNGDECPVCAALASKVFPIDKVPKLPPEGCTCVPWCRLLECASRGPG